MNFPHKIRHERGNFDKDDEGGAKPRTWTILANNVEAFVQPDNAAESIEHHRLNGLVFYKVYVPTDLDARVQDRIVTLNGSFAGKTLNVLGQRDMAGQDRIFRIECEDKPIGQHLQDAS